MPQTSRLLPVGIAVVLSTTLLGGGVAAADLRGDERRAQQERDRVAAAERLAREEEAYRVTVRGLAEEVFDQVQPLQEAADRVVKVEDGSFTVLSDVSGKGGGAVALTALRDRVQALVPPPTLVEAQRELDRGLRQLVEGADTLVASVDPALPDDAFPDRFSRGDKQLDQGVRTLNSRLQDLFTGQAVPSLAAESGAPAAGRAPVGKAAYLSTASGVCVATPPDTPDTPDGLRRDAGFLRGLIDRLVAVPTPPADAELLRTSVVEPLERARVVPDAVEQVAGAVDRRDARALSAAELALERGSLELTELAKGFLDYGSETCSITFGDDEPDGDEPTERPA